MGRRKRNRGKNKNKNRNRNKNRNHIGNTVSGAVTMKFLKRDGEVGLFMDDDGKKYRVHQAHIYGTLGWMPKGSHVAVKAAYATPVTNKRILVTNCPDWFMNGGKPSEDQPEDEPYIYESEGHVVDSDFMSSKLGLPIGTQYHWISLTEFPKVGDFVMGSTSGEARGVLGYVTDLSEFRQECTINGVQYSIYAIGYRILNPMYLQGFVIAEA
jgi:hypothetical protein